MSENLVKYPGPGCIVEYMEGNSPQIAWVSEEQDGKLRVLLPSRRETRLSANRLLPWSGPAGSATLGKDEVVNLLARHAVRREELCRAVDPLAAWEAVQGELDYANVLWFAELFENEPDIDTVAAYGRALLACKSHFKYQPPDFAIYTAELVQVRLAEQQAQRQREILAARGSAFVRLLWDVHCKKRKLPPPESEEWPDAASYERICALVLARMTDPDSQEDEGLWRQLTKGLPDLAHVPLHLAVACGLVPEHHNFWLDRAAYAPGDEWAQAHAPAIKLLREDFDSRLAELPPLALPFVSIDGKSTRDVDDAFFVEALPDEHLCLHLALACPALGWPFGSELDKVVLRRATSIYLPEATHHMLPEELGTGLYSLLEREQRPILHLSCEVNRHGELCAFACAVNRATLAANLNFSDCEEVLCQAEETGSANPALPYREQLVLGERLALRVREARIRRGAVLMERPDPAYHLEGEGASLVVRLEENPPQRSQSLIAEMMILGSAALAEWAIERDIALLYRTQDVPLPREYAGIWTQPHDMARIMKALAPSDLQAQPRPHAALGLAAYSPVSSPLRRYPDLINEMQLVNFVTRGTAYWTHEELAALLPLLSSRLELAGQVQRFRPRYWKLLYVRQYGDKVWWNGVVTEENDNFVALSLPREQIFVRGKRKLFGDRVYAGQNIQVRLGRINPLYNEISILEACES